MRRRFASVGDVPRCRHISKTGQPRVCGSATHLQLCSTRRGYWSTALHAMPDPKTPKPVPPESEDSERSRFARFAKKLVQVPKKEIDEKAEEWKRERGHKR
jgi:hypothetical protein